jgi:hypothetical protein
MHGNPIGASLLTDHRGSDYAGLWCPPRLAHRGNVIDIDVETSHYLQIPFTSVAHIAA